MSIIVKVDREANIKMALGIWQGIPWPGDPVGTEVIDEITGEIVLVHMDYNLKFFVPPPHDGEYFHAWLEE